MVITRVGVASAVKIFAALYAGLGVVAGLMFAAFATVGMGIADQTPSGDGPPAWLLPIFGVGAIVFFPILYGVLGAVFGAVTSALYNLFARLVGGLEIETQPVGVTQA
jgi:hypothetical protein